MSKVLLGDIAAERKETLKNSDGTLPIVGLEHLEPDEVTLQNWSTGVETTFTKVFKKGDILFGRRRAYLRKAALAPFDGICSSDITVIEARADKIIPELLPFVIQNERMFEYAVGKSAGSLSPRVKWEHLKNYELNLPSLEEQQRLATLLWSMDETKKTYQKLLQQTDELVKSQFMEQFKELINKPEMCSRIEDECTVFADGDWIESNDQSDEGIRLIQTGNIGNAQYLDKGERARYITDDTFERLNCTEVKANDILISRLPDPVGRACVIPEGLGKSITAVDCTIVRLGERILPEYFIAYTLSPFYMRQVTARETGSTRKRISRKNLGLLKIPIPTIAEQERFATIVRQSDKSKFELKQALERLEMLYKGILAKYLG